jgi:hypothetical protein
MKKRKYVLSYENILYYMESEHRDKILKILVSHNKTTIFHGIAEILLITKEFKKAFPQDSTQYEKEGAEALATFIMNKYNKGMLNIPSELIQLQYNNAKNEIFI